MNELFQKVQQVDDLLKPEFYQQWQENVPVELVGVIWERLKEQYANYKLRQGTDSEVG